MRVLGIDTSLTGTGLARPDGSLYTVKSNPSGGAVADRHDRLTAIVQTVVDGAIALELAVIEQPAYSRNAGSMHDRSGLWWLVVHRLFDLGVPVLEVPPTSLKKYATGKGTATKGDMRMALYKRAGLDIGDDNQVDAWWLRALGHDFTGHPLVELPEANRSALAKLLTPIAI